MPTRSVRQPKTSVDVGAAIFGIQFTGYWMEATLCGPLPAEALQHYSSVSRENGKRRTHITNWLIMRLLVKPNKLKCQIISSLAHTLEIFHFHNWLLCKSKVYSWEKSIQIWTCLLKCLKYVGVVKSKVQTLTARTQVSVGGHKNLWRSRRNAIPARRRSAASQKKR